MSEIALKITDLVKTYKGGVQALKGINLEIKKGEFFALLGANGAGKTTTIGIATDLVNKTSGKVEIFGVDIDKNFDKAKNFIGVVPQEFNFNMFEKVIDIVVQQGGYYGIPRGEAVERAHQILEELGLGDKKQAKAMALSGGMKRRLMIARALIHQPKLLILDEPTAGVDVELRHGMWDYLTRLRQEQGVTILLTTHYLEEVEQLCEKAAIIKEGKIIKEDTVKNLLKSLDHEVYVLESNESIPELEKKVANIKSDFADIKVVGEDLEATLENKNTVNELFELINKAGISIIGMRPKGNRLEELFLSVLRD
jgi:ABC-2 type transport system ATP-binding protein